MDNKEAEDIKDSSEKYAVDKGSELTANSEEKTNRFHVNRDLIPSAAFSEKEVADELKELGLDVFNQDDFEQGVMAQVDEALAKEEEEKKKKQLEKEEMDIKYDIAKVKKELETLNKVITSLGNAASTSSHVKNRLASVQKQKENKMSQLKTLLTRQKAIQIKLHGTSNIETEVQDPTQNQDSTNLNQLLGLGTGKESEKEKMIRLGQMTPFGTVITTEAEPKTLQDNDYCQPSTSKHGEQHRNKSSRLEVRSNSSDSVASKESHTSSSHQLRRSNSDTTISKSDKADNFFDAKDKKHYRNNAESFYEGKPHRSKLKYKIGHNFMEDSAISDEEAHYQDDSDEYLSDEYRPTEKELRYVSTDSGLSDADDINVDKKAKKPKKRKLSLRPKKPPKFVTSDDEDGNLPLPLKRKISREPGVRTKDDGDDELYEIRMSEFNSAEIMRNKKIDSGDLEEPEDKEFEGGLKVPGRIWSKLFDYQKIGVSWLWELHYQQAGGIIGDEMGLGKTIQMIAFMAALRQSKLRSSNFRYKGIGPTVIVCPTTVMVQWVREFHKWWPLFRVAILHSSGSFTCSEEELVRKIIRCNGVLITSFSTLVIHQDAILPYDWHYVVLDEGHKIRNPDAQITLACKQFRTPHRIILSGSPIQNNLKELWSLFDFVFPGKLGTLPDFMAHFSIPIVQGGYANATQIQVQTAYKCACVLRDTINPYLLRRMKADVKINLPSKNEQVLFCRLTEEQREVYLEYLQSRECQAILQGRFQIFAGLITLRKLCNHADICTGGPKLYIGEDTKGDPSLEYGYWRRSGKMIVVEALLKLWKKQGHRVLLFSQSRAMLDILEKFILDQSYTYLRMDGGTPISSRQPLINTFNKDPSIYLFLLTTRVGGLGVNLTGANKVIIYDPDWNPSTDTQARERTWRIGQTKQVTIYRLLTSGTIEEKIYHRQIFKQFLTNRVLKDPKQRRFFKSNDLYELFDLGSKDGKEGTETSALFAGTGSEVRKSEIKNRVNRFDLIREKQKKEQKPVLDEEDNKFFEAEEIKRMRELAKTLSMKLNKNKSSKAEVEKSKSENKFLRESKTKTSKQSIGERFLDNNAVNIERNSEKYRSASSLENKMENDSCDKCFKERAKDENKSGDEASKKQHHDKSKDKNSQREKEREKKHKRKKHKDAKFEGEKIPNLVKQDVYKANTEEEEESKSRAQEDDYVLHRLFKKTGMECAMKHDVIMDPDKHDYMIIESEAERIAKEAAKALKRSRSNCNDAKSGIPTWTGQSGAKRPRFGNKKNSLLVDKSRKDDPILTKPRSDAPSSTATLSSLPGSSQHFDGSLAGNVVKNLQTGASAENAMSSEQLILQMKKRNEVVTKPPDPANEEEDEDDTSLPRVDDESVKLISEIKNFVLFGCSMIGKASTQEILDEFGKKLPPSDSPKFKAMLQKICNFEKVNGIGFWKLKSEFRN